jgi:hypothetical protein
MTPAGKAPKQQYQWEAKAQWKGKPLVGDVRADITLYFSARPTGIIFTSYLRRALRHRVR